MNNLPYDISRCIGTEHQTCQTCIRREPGHAPMQSYIRPAIFSNGECWNQIEQRQSANKEPEK